MHRAVFLLLTSRIGKSRENNWGIFSKRASNSAREGDNDYECWVGEMRIVRTNTFIFVEGMNCLVRILDGTMSDEYNVDGDDES